MEHECLNCKVNCFYYKRYFFVIQRPCYKNMLNYDKAISAEKLRQYKNRFSVTKEQTMNFALSTYLVNKVKNFPPDFKGIA